MHGFAGHHLLQKTPVEPAVAEPADKCNPTLQPSNVQMHTVSVICPTNRQHKHALHGLSRQCSSLLTGNFVMLRRSPFILFFPFLLSFFYFPFFTFLFYFHFLPSMIA
jgi:hypothetical protein